LNKDLVRRLLPAIIIALVAIGVVASVAAAAVVSGPPANRAALVASGEVSPNDPDAADAGAAPSNYGHSARIDSGHSGSVGRGDSSASGFAGLTLQDQRLADGGNQFTVEPPDQGLCTSGLQVVESVNTVFAVYDRNGHQQGPTTSLNQFYLHQHAIDRTSLTYGEFLSDPKCYFDPGIARYFMTILEIDQDPATGDFTGGSHILIAVSKTPVATTDRNAWWFYSVDTTDAGPTASDLGEPAHPDCPCFGDQPLIGADANGFFITTNEFPLFADGFNGAQAYAFDKAGLANGHLTFQHLVVNSGPLGAGNLAYSLQPATSPTLFDWDHSNNGTEYLLSAGDFDGQGDSQVFAWSITNTKSLSTATPAAVLSAPTSVPSESYVSPPPANQKAGPYPLGQALGDPEEQVNTNDDRMNQAVYAHGLLWSGLNTAVVTDGNSSHVHAGIAYFVVQPKSTGPVVAATMKSQGYVTLKKDDVYFPSIGVNAFGQAVMTFSYSGPDYFPSLGYVKIDVDHGAGAVTPLAQGTKPDDGFTGYPQYGGPEIGRWGDYSAAVADYTGTIWVAGEWIPGTFGYVPGAATPPSFIANWGTFVGQIRP
jgi:hypothetical protein